MFDSVVFTTAQLLRVPIAALILVGEDRAWPKASVGPLARYWDRAAIFAETAVQTGEPLLLEDADADPRFANVLNAPPGEDGLRFCVAFPVIGPDGFRIGALLALAPSPRPVPRRQLMYVQQVVEQAGELLRLRVPGLDLMADRRLGPVGMPDRALRAVQR